MHLKKVCSVIQPVALGWSLASLPGGAMSSQ